MSNQSIFKSGDAVNYKDGMDYKDFTGTVESSIAYKGAWHYLVKDQRDNSIKRVGERFLSFAKEDANVKRNKFKVGELVRCTNERESFCGVIERSIQNYLGQWQYIVKDPINKVKRIDEKHLQLNS